MDKPANSTASSRRKKGRGNGEGTIVKRKDGRWMANITVGFDENGEQKRRSFYGKTREEAATKMTKALGELMSGTYIDPNRVSVGQWLDTWLEQYVKPSLRPKTFQSYEGACRLHLKPRIGGTALRTLQPAQVQRLVNDMVTAGKSARTAGLAQTVLHAALKQAVANGLVHRNAAEGARKPKGTARRIRVLTIEEQHSFVAAAADDRFGPMIVTLLGTGMRLGEAVALRWENVDLTEKVLRVVESASRVTQKGTKSRITIQAPKTSAGVRSIPLPAIVITALVQRRKQQAAERLKVGSVWVDSGLVFTTALGGILEPRGVERKAALLAKKAGIEHVNVHALRHTCATRLIEAGIPLKVVQEMLGHTSIAITGDIYVHVLPDLKQSAAAALDASLRG